MTTLISLSGALGLSSTRQLGSRSFGGFSPPLTNRYNFLAWWGLWSSAWGCNIRKYRAYGPEGNGSTYSWASCSYCPSIYPTKSMPHRPLSTWELDPTGYSKEWNSPSSPIEVSISCHPFDHSFRSTFFLCLDEDHPAFPSSLASPPPLRRSLHLQHSCISWPCTSYQPSSSSLSCR